MAKAKQVFNRATQEWVEVDSLKTAAPMPEGATIGVDPRADGIRVRADGSLRRPGSGGRTISDFFSPENLRRPLVREEYVNLRSVEEYHRRERTWWRRLYRFVRGWPPVKDMLGAMASSHAQTLDQLRAALLKRANEVEDSHSRAVADEMLRGGPHE